MSLDSAPPPCHTRRRAADLGPLSFGCGLDLASSHLCSINFAGCGAAKKAGHVTARRQLLTAQDSMGRTKAHAGARAAARDGVRSRAGRSEREYDLPAARVRPRQERHRADAHQGRSGPRHGPPKRAPVPLCAYPSAIHLRFRPASRSFAWRSLRSTLLQHLDREPASRTVEKKNYEFGDHPMAMPRDEARKAEFSGLLDNDAVAHEAAGSSVAAASSGPTHLELSGARRSKRSHRGVMQ